MIWIIIFLGIIAISDLISIILQIKTKTAEKSIELLTNQLQSERKTFSDFKTKVERDMNAQKDATNFWSKKYYDLVTKEDK